MKTNEILFFILYSSHTTWALFIWQTVQPLAVRWLACVHQPHHELVDPPLSMAVLQRNLTTSFLKRLFSFFLVQVKVRFTSNHLCLENCSGYLVGISLQHGPGSLTERLVNDTTKLQQALQFSCAIIYRRGQQDSYQQWASDGCFALRHAAVDVVRLIGRQLRSH